ncbi:MAG: PepSY-like domain-containing protein [Bacteroidetes bacterium]|uniref:PepSY-like domain-containing protein n=1 Tax=Candidatus Cryptobacteroides merdigallinarum TaxID=2840770 RepID=A0A9D9EH91_9BACT|nr:PepSY-like domain-containing protein [Candidatus Cryptobacteroides merdigallinarum]
MKKLALFFAALFAGITLFQGCEETKIKFEKLPGAAQTFITQYFPGIDVVFAEKERDNGTRHYNVRLADGTELDFDADGNWTSVDCEYSILPSGILSSGIETYIATNYPDAKAYKVEKEFGGFEVWITGGRALVFNANGEYVRESR